MSVKTKKRFKTLGKICGALLFTLLMFTNIKVAMMEDTDILKGDISILGIELNLFEESYAKPPAGDYMLTTCTLSSGQAGVKCTAFPVDCLIEQPCIYLVQ